MKNSVFSGMSFVLCIVSVLIIISLSGCGLRSTPIVSKTGVPSSQNLGKASSYTNQLADQLFAAMLPDRQYRYAVAGFVPVDSLKHNSSAQGPLMLLGHQLEQGLITEAAQRGFITQDFKVANGIIIDDSTDRVLSRDIDQLTEIQRIDYYITGTITAEQSGATVNARVIDARNKDVVAAATQFFPSNIFWTQERVTTRNGQLYRTTQLYNEVEL